MVGCAFIQYSNIQEASKALKNLNGKPFLQRPIAIDWAVPKDQFQQSNPKPTVEEKEEEPDEDKEETNQMDTEDQNIEDHEDDSKSSEGSIISDGDEDEVENEMQEGEQNLETPPKKQKWEKGHDVGENKTVFVRNLSFKSDEEDFKDMMEYNFGKVIFARFVIDKVTEHPKGSAFV